MTQEVEILLIEDNDSDAQLIIRAIEKFDLPLKYIHLEDGSEAEDFIFSAGKYADRKSESLPKLILLDLKMQKLGGLELLKKIKSDEKTKVIPVVILTSSKEEKNIMESYKEGANSFIFKTVKYEEFFNKLNFVFTYWLKINHSAL